MDTAEQKHQQALLAERHAEGWKAFVTKRAYERHAVGLTPEEELPMTGVRAWSVINRERDEDSTWIVKDSAVHLFGGTGWAMTGNAEEARRVAAELLRAADQIDEALAEG
ncbi:hypothetical protein [Kineococcus rhizosphaerae]|uniref:Uncharacterized protein n=1 Tax=Kineococcus rhizosphaerae TaxID=559628 RepID=A0A2T0QTL7_9ACTN|nr:hypothetical protein [Kineococcus rhizosphaerae]PRY08425.1 hypothetical protein CLV37_12420 [Kineococcus rhizosphaerae]